MFTMYDKIGAFILDAFIWILCESKSSQWAWFPSVVKEQKGFDKVMNIKHILRFHSSLCYLRYQVYKSVFLIVYQLI